MTNGVPKMEIVPLHDDAIYCVRDESVKIVLKPTVEEMGLDYGGQHKRLSQQAWATISVTEMVAADGRKRAMVTIDRRTFAMWLATIDASRLQDPDIRAKVEMYQREAADVLDRHFFGSPSQPTIPDGSDPIGLALYAALETRKDVAEVRRDLGEFKGEVRAEVGEIKAKLADRRPAKLSNAEKRARVAKVLRNPLMVARSDASISRDLTVSPPLVAEVRRELEGVGSIQEQPIRACADGKLRDISYTRRPSLNGVSVN